MLSAITVREARKLRVVRKWKLPRSMEKGGIFYPYLSTHLSAAAQRKEQQGIAEISRHPLLTEKLAEIQFRVQHSGYWLGKNKCNSKRGDSALCPECGEVEDVIHTFCSCRKINKFWQKTFKWWGRRTSENVPTSPKETLLGIRPSHQSTSYKELALPFTYLRTQALSTIKNERSRRKKGIPARSTDQLLQDTLKNVQKSANSLYVAACKWDKWNPPKGEEVHYRSVRAFNETWVKSGLAKITPTKAQHVILRAHGH